MGVLLNDKFPGADLRWVAGVASLSVGEVFKGLKGVDGGIHPLHRAQEPLAPVHAVVQGVAQVLVLVDFDVSKDWNEKSTG